MLPKYFREILFLMFLKSLIFRDREEERGLFVIPVIYEFIGCFLCVP